MHAAIGGKVCTLLSCNTDYSCVLCNSPPEESVLHLFLACPFATDCCASLGLVITQSDDPFATLQDFRAQLHLPFLMEILITMCWSIWSVRTDLIFRDIQPSVERCRAIFKKEFAQVILRAKAAYQPLVSQWPEASLQKKKKARSLCESRRCVTMLDAPA